MKLKINQIFDFDKGSLQSLKNISGKYDFITASEDWKTHDEYTHDGEFLIFAMGASGSLGRTHYVNGKFISSDLCFILSPKNEYKNKINLKFYHTYFNVIREDIVKHTATGTSKIAINRKNFGNYELFLPELKFQNSFFEKFIKLKNSNDQLLEINNKNQNYIKLLKQSILQEAIEGKLTKSWREKNKDIEPASVLLEKIKEEKEVLIKQKKLKKQKELEPILEDEIPFDIPEGWEWCRLGEIAKYITDGAHQTPTYTKSGVPFLSVKDIAHGTINFSNTKYISLNEHKELYKRCNPEFGDILLTKVGTTGIAKIVDVKQEFSLFVSVALIKIFKNYLFSNYLEYLINSPLVKKYSEEGTAGVGNKNLVLRKINNFIIPLPQLEEQKEIVKRVDELMKLCDELERQTLEAKENSENLMKAVLGEVFNK